MMRKLNFALVGCGMIAVHHMAAMEYVDQYKQDRLRVTASMYLAKYPTKRQPRFDVIEIYAPDGVQTENPEIRHLEDAFR